MDRNQMLKKLGLSEHELRDLLQKLSELESGLTTAQRAVLKSSSPTLSEAAATFGPDVTADDLRAFLKQAAPVDAMLSTNIQNEEQ
jgi:hypothetical protein